MKTVTVEEARAIDRDAVERLGMPSALLMENAARAVAEQARRLGARFVVLCGPGNNGGDGLAAARHLGAACGVFLLREPDPEKSPDAALQLRILRAAGWPLVVGEPPQIEDWRGAVWIDALFGTGLRRGLAGGAAQWVERFNCGEGPKLGVDLPSGMDGDTGQALGPVCRCDVTVTFAAAKQGMVTVEGRALVGDIVVAPLGIPAPGASRSR